MAATQSNMSGNIVLGAHSKITQFPHSAFLSIHIYTCGASILNQALLLTAAHCVYDNKDPEKYTAFVGHNIRQKGSQYAVLKLTVHENFDSKLITNDIALLRLNKNLKFGRNVARVILLPDPPYDEEAFVAGWGVTEIDGMISDCLMHASQKVYKRNACVLIGVKKVPRGTICGEHKDKKGHPEQGDSGSALVVRGYIQIGIVSYNRPDVSTTNVVYTDTGYFYKWIKENSRKLYCSKRTG
ncbi:chymotrypsin-1-like [Cydia fagiglandana]|uniref:chymotrypsin-1-like n=1 Tax=Cydia fagiglandana TaxID=1458189 RepID=UPI002FEE2014